VSCAGKAKTNHSVHFYCHFLQSNLQEIGGTEKFMFCFGFKKSKPKPNINFSVPPQEMLPHKKTCIAGFPLYPSQSYSTPHPLFFVLQKVKNKI